MNILKIHFLDGRKILNNLLEVNYISSSIFSLRLLWLHTDEIDHISHLHTKISKRTLVLSFQFRLLAISSLTSHHFITFLNWQGRDLSIHKKLLESDITLYVGTHELELATRVNCAAHSGDLYRLKCLIEAGANPNNTNYDGRSALVRIN